MKANLKDENSFVSSFHYFWQRVFISGKRLETFHSCTFCDFAFFKLAGFKKRYLLKVNNFRS